VKKDKIKFITYNGVLAAVYVAITFLTIPISFGQIQFRFAEILVLLCFFNKKSSAGIILGTFVANLFSTLGLWDLLFGVGATIVTCLFVCFSRHLLLAIVWPILFNGLIIGAELFFLFGNGDVSLFFINAGYVALGELAVMIVGYIIFMLIRKRKDFAIITNANQNIDFKF
jgi:uncharacterized membrane protein